MKKADYKDKDIKELEKMLASKKLDLVKNQVTIASSKDKNVKRAWEIKKEIAHLLTLINLKKYASENK